MRGKQKNKHGEHVVVFISVEYTTEGAKNIDTNCFMHHGEV